MSKPKRRSSRLWDASEQIVDSQEPVKQLEQAIFWTARIRLGEDLRLQDLCLSTVQKHITTLVQYVKPWREPSVYRSICPGCGRAIELERSSG